MEEFYITDDGIRLHAKLERPKDCKRGPLVIIFHGFTGHMEEEHIVAVAEAVREIGFASLRVELYGHGKSDGRFEDHTLFKWISNAMAVIEYVKHLDFVTELYLCGHSQGGLLAALTAGMRPDDCRALLLLSPALNIPDDARKGEILGVTFDLRHPPERIAVWDATLKSDYIRVAKLIHIEDAIQAYDGPVLIVHGEADDTVPIRYSMDASEKYKNGKLVIVPGDTHCYEYHLEAVTSAVKEFLCDAKGEKSEDP